MVSQCQKLVEAYLRWLRTNISVAEINGVCEITTPFLDRHNDHLQIYVRRAEDKLELTDDAYVISDLKLCGCSLDTPKRKELLNSIAGGFGVAIVGDEITATAQVKDFPRKKHAIIQAMLAISDLFATASARVASLFLEDVTRFLDLSDVRYTPAVQFTGKSGFAHKFDFAIPRSPRAPERLVRAVNRPTKDNATSAIFSWTDIRESRDESTKMYAFLNDAEQTASPDIIDALRSYEIVPVPWSERQEHTAELAA